MSASVLIAALEHVWLTLAPLNRRLAVMGGLAVAAWGRLRATQDLDLLIGIDEAALGPVLERLATAGLRPKHQTPVLALGPLRVVQLLYEPPGAFVDVQVDLLLAESAYHQTSLSRRVALDLPGVEVEIFTLTCEDLILHKLLAGRILDRSDVAALLRHNRATLDQTYLLSWAGQLGLIKELAEVWEEAFPGEKLLAPPE
jgi:hypothetical protein